MLKLIDSIEVDFLFSWRFMWVGCQICPKQKLVLIHFVPFLGLMIVWGRRVAAVSDADNVGIQSNGGYEMRRNEMLIDSREDALQWLEEFGHTITDEPLKRVIEQLQTPLSCDECSELHD